jgi:predicted alpha/beta-hydrolase family hydrolase
LNRLAGKEISIPVNDKAGIVSALHIQPADAKAMLVIAHGAGAGMRHPFMETVSVMLAKLGVATLRYQFPYMERRGKRPDHETILIDTVRAAVATGQKLGGKLALFAGGKSMGGRMTSLAAARQPLDGVRGLVFFGFPLHASGRPSTERGAHLAGIKTPMLFLQGSRDTLADLKLLKPLCAHLGNQAELFIIEGGDHSFHMLKSAHRSDNEIIDELVAMASKWMSRI